MTLPSDFSRANLNVGRSLPDKAGSGTLFMKLGSPATAGCAPPIVASEAIPAAATRNSRRCGSDMLSSWWDENPPANGHMAAPPANERDALTSSHQTNSRLLSEEEPGDPCNRARIAHFALGGLTGRAQG